MTVLRVLPAVALLLAAAACSGASSQGSTDRSAPGVMEGLANIGGYSLAYECKGAGNPAVILEAGYTASGIDTYGSKILPTLARTTRVCTYDRAGDGTSDPRPVSVKPLTAATQARELHALLGAIHGSGRYVLVGHSYGGMISREFAALYPSQVVGMVLIDASSEPEIPVYDRLHAGPWLDGTVTPAPNRKIDIYATVRQLEHAPPLRALPLIVITAGILEDQWLRTVPLVEARAQTRLANISTNSVHVLDKGVGHFIPQRDPTIVVDAVEAVITAARTGHRLASCRQIFHSEASAECLARGALARQQT